MDRRTFLWATPALALSGCVSVGGADGPPAPASRRRLAPDVDVALSDEDRTEGRDPQLDAAIAAARGDAVTDREDANTGG